ncbi:MAG: TrkH family potassium uptake protein [Ruminococcaceae bacterium]|nr:TrkH family potassium uptake protein [Oscillospiraceae bacterium]
MNRKMIFYVVGQIIKLEALLMVLPMACALIYGEYRTLLAFGITVAGALLVGCLITLSTRKCDRTIYAREGFIICAFAWIAMSAIGAVPFVISGDIPSYTDAFFETVSGFTTTGASILASPEPLSHGALFWRSFTHWIGGMGVLVLMMAVIPTNNDRSIHIMRAEMPGPIVDKIVPRVRNTATILYLIYVVMTFVLTLFLLAGGMDLFAALTHAFGTAGTGGFGIMGDSIGSYSPYIQWVLTIGMLVFGVNFNLYYLILIKKFKQAIRSEELWVYIAIVVISVTVIAGNIASMYPTVSETVRYAAFQVASIITTTGYSTTDFNLWPGFSKTLLLMLMFIGGCAGSTAGGLKVSRVVILGKTIRRELKVMIHPRSVPSVKLDGKRIDDTTKNGVCSYLALYIIVFAVILFFLSLEPFDLETNISAVAACFNNIGPGLSGVGPMANYSAYSAASKYLLSAAMLLGRLELYPLILSFSPSTWIKK